MQSNKLLKPILILIPFVVAASLSYLILKAIYDPNIPFLTADAKANWIRYPFTAELKIRKNNYINLTAGFTKNFELVSKPSKVYLYVKGFKEYRLWINDNQLSAGSKEINWKLAQGFDITQYLKEGTNTIKAEVFNGYGPPALWLYTQGMQNDIKTDASWTVSVLDSPPISAILADDCFLHPISSQFVRPLDALFKKLPMLILFFLISSVIFWLSDHRQVNAKFKPLRTPRFSIFTPKKVLIICIILWTIIFIKNTPWISLTETGFDARDHFNYIKYLLDNKSIPLANEGWEFYQPPLFYFVSAVLLSLSKLFLPGNNALYSLKLIPFLGGLGQIILIYFAARMVFPDCRNKQSLSVAIMALMPMNIYISSYLSNESFAAFLMGLTIVITLKILKSNQDSLKFYCILGLVIGLAFLTKFTVLAILPVVFLVLLYKLLSEEKKPVTAICLNLGSMFLLIFAIAGWFYIRNWMHFSRIIVGNWDCSSMSSMIQWWQDPGFHTYKYFGRFGRVFIAPYCAGTYSFFDSLYSTFWGDAFLGSADRYTDRTPWNYEYMSAVFLLAIPATLAIITGAICAIINAMRTAGKIWLLILGSFFVLVYSIIYMNLLLPYYGQSKAFYGLGTVLPISLLFALGYDHIDCRLKDKKLFLGRMVLYGWFGTFIIAISLAFFVTPGQAKEVFYSDLGLRAKYGELDQAVIYYTQIVRNNPDNCEAHCQLAKAYFLQQAYDKAIEHFSCAIRIKPDYIDALDGLGVALCHTEKIEQAISHYNKALLIAPDSVEMRLHLGFALSSSGKLKEAAAEYEKILLIQPDNIIVHNDLGVVLIRQGKINEAIAHLRQAVKINPDYIDAKNNLNAVLAEKQKSSN